MHKNSGNYGEKLGYKLKHNISSLVNQGDKPNKIPVITTAQEAYDGIAERELNGEAHQQY